MVLRPNRDLMPEIQSNTLFLQLPFWCRPSGMFNLRVGVGIFIEIRGYFQVFEKNFKKSVIEEGEGT